MRWGIIFQERYLGLNLPSKANLRSSYNRLNSSGKTIFDNWGGINEFLYVFGHILLQTYLNLQCSEIVDLVLLIVTLWSIYQSYISVDTVRLSFRDCNGAYRFRRVCAYISNVRNYTTWGPRKMVHFARIFLKRGFLKQNFLLKKSDFPKRRKLYTR